MLKMRKTLLFYSHEHESYCYISSDLRCLSLFTYRAHLYIAKLRFFRLARFPNYARLSKRVPTIKTLFNSKCGSCAFLSSYSFEELPLFIIDFSQMALPSFAYFSYRRRAVYFHIKNNVLIRLITGIGIQKKSLSLSIFRMLTLLYKHLFAIRYAYTVEPFIIAPFPVVLLRNIRHGRKYFAVPFITSFWSRNGQAIKTLAKAVRANPSFTLRARIAKENLYIFFSQECPYLEMLNKHYSTLISNRIYVHFRW